VSGWLAARKLQERHEGPSFVLLVVDCMRPDHLGCFGYTRDTSPTIDALARSGWCFERAYAPSPWTKPSVASLFTSQLPGSHGLTDPGQRAPDQLLLLAEVLRNSGYKNFLINGGNVFLKKEFNLHQGFHSYDYLPHTTRSAPDLVQTFLRRVAGVGGGRFFAYLHYMDAHAPYTSNAHNTRYATKIFKDYPPGNPATQLNALRGLDSVGPELQQYFLDLYDGQIHFVDASVRALLQGLELLGRLDNTLFIITADHGEEFWEHGSTEHGHSLYDELLHVPLIIAGSPVSARRIPEPVSLIDVMPTVLELAGIPHAGENTQAVSLVPGSGNLSPDRAIYASGTLYGPESYCLILNNRKLIYRTSEQKNKWDLSGPRAPAGYQLFDLKRDPAEKNSLASEDEAPPELENLLGDYLRTSPRFVSPHTVNVGGDGMRAQLESLGYVQ
jgi:arylsulfatase A-like enzyme